MPFYAVTTAPDELGGSGGMGLPSAMSRDALDEFGGSGGMGLPSNLVVCRVVTADDVVVARTGLESATKTNAVAIAVPRTLAAFLWLMGVLLLPCMVYARYEK